MRVALRGSYVEYVIFMGITEKYPLWFEHELSECVYQDESRYTFWTPMEERGPDYYEKQLIEDYSVFLRKPDGEVHVTDYDTFAELYVTFRYDAFTNSGIAALQCDCIEYVEVRAGVLPSGYPEWFYAYFTEAFNFPQDEETIYLYDSNTHELQASRGSLVATAGGEVSVKMHCVFLHNKYGEIMCIGYSSFLKMYDPEPALGVY
jgi:hypothetical protein